MASEGAACGRCAGVGFVPIDVAGIRRMTRCECVMRQTWATDVPIAFQDARLVNYLVNAENGHALAAAEEWLEGRRSDLYFFGLQGTGKTRLACSLLNESFERGETDARFVSISYLMLLQRQSIDDPEKKTEVNRIIDHAIAANPVCLDDLGGAEKSPDFSRITLLPIYERRLHLGRRTIWTSNLSLREVARWYADLRLTSRIAGAAGETFELSGSDWRML